MTGEKPLGTRRYQLDCAALQADIIDVPGPVPHWIDDVIDEVYPRPTAVSPARE